MEGEGGEVNLVEGEGRVGKGQGELGGWGGVGRGGERGAWRRG